MDITKHANLLGARSLENSQGYTPLSDRPFNLVQSWLVIDNHLGQPVRMWKTREYLRTGDEKFLIPEREREDGATVKINPPQINTTRANDFAMERWEAKR